MPHAYSVFQDWYDLLKARGLLKDDGLDLGPPEAFTYEDSLHFEGGWTAAPAQAGEMRFTLPTLPYGSKGPTDSKVIARHTSYPSTTYLVQGDKC